MSMTSKRTLGFLSLVALLSWGVAQEGTPAAVSPRSEEGAVARATVSWIKTYKAGDEVVDLCVDSTGNIYVTGTTNSDKPDFVTIKYNSSGKQLWAARHDAAGGEDRPSALKVDRTGNAYITGSSDGWHTAYDFLTIKYKPSGKREWFARLNNAENHSDFANDIAVDSAGSVYVTGTSRFDTTDYDIVTVKYSSAGKTQWGMRYIGPGILPNWKDDVGRFIETDAGGNIYVTGTSESGSRDIVTIKYDGSGQVLWDERFDGPDHMDDEPSGLAVDPEGNVYVAGTSGMSDSGQDIILIKYNASGAWQWMKSYTSSGNYPEDAQDIFVDNGGHAFVTGSTNVSGTNKYITLKYSPTGEREWAAKFGYGYGGGAYSVDVDGSGYVYVTGDVHSPKSSYDIVTVKYNAKGKKLWSVVYSSASEHSFDNGRVVALDPSGAVIVAGDSMDAGWVIIKYSQKS